MGPRPSFQYRRASSRLGVSRPSQSSTYSPATLQKLSNRTSRQLAVVQKPPPHPKRLSIAEPVSKKKPRRKKARRALHRDVQAGIPEEQRLKLLVETVVLNEHNTKYATTSAAEREQFEEGMLTMSDFLDNFVVQMSEGEGSAAAKHKPNPVNQDLKRRAVQLEEVVKNYKIELERWNFVEQRAATPLEVAKLLEEPEADQVAQFPDPYELVNSSAEAIETYILQTDHMRSLLRKLESRSRETHSRVQAIAAALNDRVMSEFAKKSEGGLTPPPNLVSVKVIGA